MKTALLLVLAAVACWVAFGLAVTVALAYGVGLAVAALRHAEARRRRPERSASFVRPNGRLVLADARSGQADATSGHRHHVVAP